MPIESRDIAAVDQTLRRHPRAGDLRFSVGAGTIEVYARTIPNINDMLATFGISDPESPPATGQLPGFSIRLRFVLLEESPRIFQAERRTAAGWEDCGQGALRDLARQIIPEL